MWTKWNVLAACAVITQSFPRPDGKYRPKVENLKEHSQYYVLSDNGDYKYGYNTGNGAYESVVKMGAGDVIGYFGYVDAFGKNVRLDYTAGVGGFVPKSSLLPVAPQVDEASVPSAVSGSSADASGVITESAALSQPIDEPDVMSANNLEESYSSPSESADYSTNVVGEELFVADDEQIQPIRDSAVSGTGFVAKGDSIPMVTETQTGSGRSVFSAMNETPKASVPIDIYVVPVASGRSIKEAITPRGDASFTFRFQKPDSSREDSADGDFNVKGRYNFLANDVIQRKSNFIAGPATEFVAEGNNLSVAPEATDVSASVPTGAFQATVYSGSGSSSFSSRSGFSASSEITSDASYPSEFNAVDSSMDETADSNLNVKKQYSLDADDGVTGTIRNTAGSGTQFETEGAQLPVPVSSVRTGNQLKFPADSLDGVGQTLESLGGPSFRRQDVLGDIAFESNSGDDGSYSFSYTNPDNFRSESADSDLNVRGVYSFIADDGIERHIRYRAGSGIGFVAEGTHLPVS